MQRPDGVPVGQSEEPGRVEDRRLADRRACPVPLDQELQPGAARQLHLRRQPQAAVRLEDLDPPAVEGVPHRERVRVAPAPPHPHAAGRQVQKAPQLPQPGAVVPARAPADPADGREGRGRRAVHPRGAGVDEAVPEARAAPVAPVPAGGQGVGPAGLGAVAVLVAQGAGNRLGDRQGPDMGEGPQGRVAADHGGVADAVDELAADPGEDGGHQAEPEAGEAGRQQGHGDHQAAEPPLARVLPHQVAVGDGLRSPDLEDLVSGAFQVEGGAEVLQQVLDRDGLGGDVHPLRRDHDGEPLHEGPDHLEGEAARADDDGGPELQDLRARAPQDLGDLEAAPEMGGEILAAFAESPEVDDPVHAGPARLAGEVEGRPAVLLHEIAPGAHGVDHVVGRPDSVHPPLQARRVEGIAFDDLGGGRDAVPEGLGTAGQAADPEPGVFQRAQQPPADVARGAGEEDRRGPVRCGAGRQWRRRPGSGRCGWARCGARCSW